MQRSISTAVQVHVRRLVSSRILPFAMLFKSALLLTTTLFSVALAASIPFGRDAVAYYDPSLNGGRMLDDATGGQGGSDLGEPMNVIISGLSSPDVLTDSGFLNYVQSIGFSSECLGLHLGGPQTANLGDGDGWRNQTVEYRQDYGDANLGTCLESLLGGNHLRMYRQNGPQANSGALFLAVSKEQDLAEKHNIVANGYDVGRDLLVASAIAGQTSFGGINYLSTSQNIPGLLPTGASGSSVNHNIALDGVVVLLTVTIV
ncbi:unnamed protein product [Mycena citricolor]|uniref:Uncharacterized protein n=1 Tax=Mycena citricolor TaxID=2018698 RepID=A0AAD2HU10_9AGAR|nr:unnamed protein product [Mycena citricolor]